MLLNRVAEVKEEARHHQRCYFYKAGGLTYKRLGETDWDRYTDANMDGQQVRGLGRERKGTI